MHYKKGSGGADVAATTSLVHLPLMLANDMLTS